MTNLVKYNSAGYVNTELLCHCSNVSAAFVWQVRKLISDFAIILAILIFCGVDALVGVDTPKLLVPSEFKVSACVGGCFVICDSCFCFISNKPRQTFQDQSERLVGRCLLSTWGSLTEAEAGVKMKPCYLSRASHIS